MTAVVGDVEELGGSTPLVRLEKLLGGDGPTVYAKLESFNPSGSAKDRTARLMITEALESGRIAPGDHVVESSSGNFGVALARQCRLSGLRFTCVIDPRTNDMTRRLITAYGAEILEVPEPDPETNDWLVARLDAVRRLVADADAAGRRAWWPNQYANTGNPRAHSEGTMREIMEALPSAPDVVVIATSTTGTLAGCIDYARRAGHHTRFVAVDAVGSVLFGGERGQRKLPGFGAGTVPEIAESFTPDAVVRASDLECVVGCRVLAATEGYLAGASGGGVVSALPTLGLSADETVCLILHDGGERYLNTVYDDDWVSENLDCDPDRLNRLTTSPPWGIAQ